MTVIYFKKTSCLCITTGIERRIKIACLMSYNLVLFHINYIVIIIRLDL